jgi:Zn finger protein HypA/HybF involved in hydrogenase expression
MINDKLTDMAESGRSLAPNDHCAPATKHTETLDAARFCPNCSAELQDQRCKLICPACGYYLSCSDFY